MSLENKKAPRGGKTQEVVGEVKGKKLLYYIEEKGNLFNCTLALTVWPFV